HDRVTGTTTRISVASDGTEGNNSSDWNASINANGRFMPFVSFASNLVPGDTNTCLGDPTPGRCPDVFVHDRVTGLTERVSVNSDGAQANDSSDWQPTISRTGRFIGFASNATNLIAGGGDVTPQVFVHDRLTGETPRVSVAPDGSPIPALWPSVSGNGRFV